MPVDEIVAMFLATPAGKTVPKEQIPAIKGLVSLFMSLHNSAVDGCVNLVRIWGEVKGLADTDDFRILIQHMNASRETE